MFKNIKNLLTGSAVTSVPKLNSVETKIKNPQWTFILDPGHGGIVDGQYVTPGKRSPTFPDGSVLYEGVNNRAHVNSVFRLAKNLGFNVVNLVPTNEDVSLLKRITLANKYGKKSVYISFHSDAAGNGSLWHAAKGITVFTSKGQTTSDKFADIIFKNLRNQFPDMNFRQDMTDNDPDKEENFFVLQKTVMPAVLLELGFHTNFNEAQYIQTEEFRLKMAKAVVDSMYEWEKLNP
jgi:N-acetylmuramoyl-L-alanine amidase